MAAILQNRKAWSLCHLTLHHLIAFFNWIKRIDLHDLVRFSFPCGLSQAALLVFHQLVFGEEEICADNLASFKKIPSVMNIGL